MSLIGKEGLKEVAGLCLDKAGYAKDRLSGIKGVEVKRSSPTFNEFTVKLPKDPNEVIGKMIDRGFEAGFPLGRYYKDLKNHMLIAVTEKKTKHQIDSYASALENALWS